MSKNAERDRALSALSGQSCTHAYLLQNRTRLYLGLMFAILVGMTAGLLIRQWFVASIVSFVLMSIFEHQGDRRIVGIGTNGLVQAKSALYTAHPTELLPPLHFAQVKALDCWAPKRMALFQIDGTTFLGKKGSPALASELQSKQAWQSWKAKQANQA